jgi:hypothetical protein
MRMGEATPGATRPTASTHPVASAHLPPPQSTSQLPRPSPLLLSAHRVAPWLAPSPSTPSLSPKVASTRSAGSTARSGPPIAGSSASVCSLRRASFAMVVRALPVRPPSAMVVSLRGPGRIGATGWSPSRQPHHALLRSTAVDPTHWPPDLLRPRAKVIGPPCVRAPRGLPRLRPRPSVVE